MYMAASMLSNYYFLNVDSFIYGIQKAEEPGKQVQAPDYQTT